MILLIIGSIFLICGFVLFYKAIHIILQKNAEQENYKSSLQTELNQLEERRDKLVQIQSRQEKELNNHLQEWQEYRKKEIETYLERQQELVDQQIQSAQSSAQTKISLINEDVQTAQTNASREKEKLENELENLRASLSAGVQARLREQEEKDKIAFYKLSISEEDLADVEMLERLKISFHKPVVLSKLIWSQYFQKQMNELCDRVLGQKTVCGIYKITDLITEQTYIGQSVNIAERWKQHCKCGLGIEASATNTLYKTMQKDNVWNFSFELLEECPREMLNEKEAFWIEMYSSNKYGLNTMKGHI